MRRPVTLLVLFAVVCCLFLNRSVIAQTGKAGPNGKMLLSEEQKIVHRTHKLISHSALSRRSKILGGDKELFLIDTDKPVGVMKGSSEPGESDIWYVVVTENPVISIGTVVFEDAAEPALPDEFSLDQNYPNPFNPATTIKFRIPVKPGSESIRTVLKIYDILGRLVRTVVDEELAPGFYAKQWDGFNDDGVRTSSGLYFYRIRAGDFVETKKMTLLK